MKISYGKNVYGQQEINAVVNQLKKTTQMGYSVNTFEKLIAKKFSKKFALMVNSGSSAITLAMNVLNFKKNDEIITSCLNFGTALSAILQSGATPVLVDAEVDTLQIDVKKIENINAPIPIINWIKLDSKNSKENLKNKKFYFAHGYYCDLSLRQKNITFIKVDNKKIISSYENKNLYFYQFHPELSGQNGLDLLKKFKEL